MQTKIYIYIFCNVGKGSDAIRNNFTKSLVFDSIVWLFLRRKKNIRYLQEHMVKIKEIHISPFRFGKVTMWNERSDE